MIEIEPGLLDSSTCYLSGAMDYVADHGIGWRRAFIDLCRQRNLKIDFIDPTNKPGEPHDKIDENKSYQTSLKVAGKFRELQEYVKGYRHEDLRYVDGSDFLVAVINPKVPQWGTSDEIYTAERQQKPIFFVIEGGLKNLPNWLFAVVNLGDGFERSNVFDSIEDVVDELVLIDDGSIPMCKKWVLFRKHLERSRS